MDALEQLALTGNVWARAVLSAFVRPLAVVALAAFAGPVLVAIALADFAHPLLSPVMLRIVQALGDERALHYPGTLALLPALLAQLGRATDWLMLTLLLGWAGAVTAYGPQGMSSGSALLATLQRLPRLLVAGVPLVLAHSVVVGLSAQAIADLPHRLISAALHLVVALGLEAVVLAAGVIVLPVFVRSDLSLRRVPGALRRAWRWEGVGATGFGMVMAVMAVAGRLVFARAAGFLTATRPDGVLWVVIAAAFLTAVGIVVFATASVVMAAALDEGWA